LGFVPLACAEDGVKDAVSKKALVECWCAQRSWIWLDAAQHVALVNWLDSLTDIDTSPPSKARLQEFLNTNKQLFDGVEYDPTRAWIRTFLTKRGKVRQEQ